MASKPKKRINLRFFFIIFALLIVYAGATLIKQQLTISDLNAQAAEISEQLQQTKDSNEQLSRDIDQSGSDEYIERQAREKLNWVKKDETRFIEK